MLIVSLTVSPWAANCYLVGPDSGTDCVVIDPGIGGLDVIIPELENLRRKPVAVVGTHGHIDHVGDAAPLADFYDIPVLLHPLDQPMLTHPAKGLGDDAVPILRKILGTEFLPAPGTVIDLADREPVTLAGITFMPRLAPGHTPGSMLLDAGSVVFTGDVIFEAAIGRMDLPGGSVEQMKHTLSTVLPDLDTEATLYPGHGRATTLAKEIVDNPYLRYPFLQPDLWK